jgi:hypothetical protein
MVSGREDAPATGVFGFLTVRDAAGAGTFGGYLLVDLSGRPLEFHCTAPVRVTRAQEILYGATLARQLHGEQIGGPLLKATAVKPVVVLTDRDSLLHARSHSPSPVAVVRRGAESLVGRDSSDLVFGGFAVQLHGDDADRLEAVRPQLTALADSIELVEPFERIQAAIEEAQRHS